MQLRKFCCVNCGSGAIEFKYDAYLRSDATTKRLGMAKSYTNFLGCNQCGLIQRVTAPDNLRKYYCEGSEYYESYTDNCLQNQERARSSYKNQWISKVITGNSAPGRALEIGCGDGELLMELSVLGYKCIGIDPVPMSRSIQESEIRVLHGYLEDYIEALGGSVDLVILVDVIEHVEDVQLLQRQIREILRSKGVLVVATGNSNSLNARLSGRNWGYVSYAEHLQAFNVKSLDKFYKLSGCEIKEVHKYSNNFSVFVDMKEFCFNLAKWLVNKTRITTRPHGLVADHVLTIGERVSESSI